MESLGRDSHEHFFLDRDWTGVSNFWTSMVRKPTEKLPEWLRGDGKFGGKFGVTDVKAIHEVGEETGEFSNPDVKYSKRFSFCLRIAYDGSAYHGYQFQPEGIKTVERDLRTCLRNRKSTMAAGRTDSDVSALSQLVYFSTFENITPEDILNDFRECEPSLTGNLVLHECYRVPRRFHPLFLATWRRYCYVFPLNVLNSEKESSYDVDVKFLSEAFNALVGKPLPYNAYSYGPLPLNEDGRIDDECVILHTSVRVIDISSSDGSPSFAACIELVGNRFLRRMVRILVATACRQASLSVPSNANDNANADANENENENGNHNEKSANYNVLLEIALGGDRKNCALPLPGVGLALAGVGINMEKLDYRKRGEKKTPSHIKNVNSQSSIRKARKDKNASLLITTSTSCPIPVL